MPADAQRRPLADSDEPVTMQAYDPVWPERFEDERRLLQPVLDEFISGGIHHVGSTAVPGLDAKPVIDILAGIPGLAGARPCIDLLVPLSYLYAPYRTGEMLWFCKPDPARRTHHLHLVPVGSARYRDELLFRDYLRAHPDARTDYARLKHDLAIRHRQDREAYTESKTAFVQKILRQASGPDG